MPTRDFELTDHQSEMIETLVKSGRYKDASDVVGEALRLVERRESEINAKREALRAAAQIGVDAIEQGRYKQFKNMDEAIAYLTEISNEILEPAKGH